MLGTFPIKPIITCSHFTTERGEIAVDSSTHTTITVAVKKTALTGKDSMLPLVYYKLDDGIAKGCHYFKDNNTHDACIIEHLVPAKRNTLRFMACSLVFCTTFSSSQTVWTLPRSKCLFSLMEFKQL